jgi:transposase
MRKAQHYSPEIRERAVRLVKDHQHEHDSEWAAMTSVADKIGCTSETLRRWVRRAERDAGKRPGPTTAESGRIKQLEREVREPRRSRTSTKARRSRTSTRGEIEDIHNIATILRGCFESSAVAPRLI